VRESVVRSSVVRKISLRQISAASKRRTRAELEGRVPATQLCRVVFSRVSTVADLDANDSFVLDQALGALPPIAPTQPDAAEATVPPTVPLTPSRSESAPVEPHPVTAIPDYQTFGPDPSTFDDPTVYDLPKVDPDMTEEEKKRVLGVVYYPQDDLHDLTPGTPPDRDFSNAKPANQVTANQFATYLEPYVRPLTEDDLAFLKERVRPVI